MHYSVAELHGALTHFPIAMLIAAAMFDIGAPMFRKPEWRVVSFWLLVTAVVGSVPSLISGWITGNEFYGQVASPPQTFVLHRLAAFTSSGLALLLLIWRVATKDRLAGGALTGSVVLAVAAAGVVGYTGFLGGQMAMGGGSDETTQGSVVSGKTVSPPDPRLVIAGKLLYTQNGCANCHRIDGHGMLSGPDLSHEGSRNADITWQISHLKDPASVHPNSYMPAYKSLGDTKLKALANYLMSLK